MSGSCVTGVSVGSSGSPSKFGSTFVGFVGSSELSDTGVPLGVVPVAVAIFVILPLLICDCVNTSVAVNVELFVAPGASVANGPPVTVTNGSVTVILLKVTLPVLVTAKV